LLPPCKNDRMGVGSVRQREPSRGVERSLLLGPLVSRGRSPPWSRSIPRKVYTGERAFGGNARFADKVGTWETPTP